MELYLHFPMCIHGVMFKSRGYVLRHGTWLSTGMAFPLP